MGIPAQSLIQCDPYIANYRLPRQFLFQSDRYLISLLPIETLTLFGTGKAESDGRPQHLTAAPGAGRQARYSQLKKKNGK